MQQAPWIRAVNYLPRCCGTNLQRQVFRSCQRTRTIILQPKTPITYSVAETEVAKASGTEPFTWSKDLYVHFLSVTIVSWSKLRFLQNTAGSFIQPSDFSSRNVIKMIACKKERKKRGCGGSGASLKVVSISPLAFSAKLLHHRCQCWLFSLSSGLVFPLFKWNNTACGPPTSEMRFHF